MDGRGIELILSSRLCNWILTLWSSLCSVAASLLSVFAFQETSPLNSLELLLLFADQPPSSVFGNAIQRSIPAKGHPRSTKSSGHPDFQWRRTLLGFPWSRSDWLHRCFSRSTMQQPGSHWSPPILDPSPSFSNTGGSLWTYQLHSSLPWTSEHGGVLHPAWNDIIPSSIVCGRGLSTLVPLARQTSEVEKRERERGNYHPALWCHRWEAPKVVPLLWLHLG